MQKSQSSSAGAASRGAPGAAGTPVRAAAPVAAAAPIGAAALAAGFAAAVAMWAVGFLARLPPALLPNWLTLLLLLACLGAGGAFAARGTRRALAGAGAGLVASVVNLLVLGSLLAGDQPNSLVPTAMIWLPGSLGLGTLIGLLGGALALRGARDGIEGSGASPASGAIGALPDAASSKWTGTLARVAALATLFLVMVGGLVTSKDAGLAVVDWPNSYGYQMFLYPLSRMIGGIYYEHAHRLFGSLVGLATVVLAARIALTDARAGVKALAGIAVLFVVGQGVLGGLRVTGHFTLSSSTAIVRPSLALAMVHGVVGQLFFGLMTALAVVTSATWREARGRIVSDDAGTDRAFGAIVLGALLLQLLLGVRTRHTGEGALIHMTFAVVVLVVATLASARVLAKRGEITALRKSGAALLGHVWSQVILGIAAFVLVSRRGGTGEAPPLEVIVATAHQTVGALLLANAVVLFLWSRHLVVPDNAVPSPVAGRGPHPAGP